MKKDEAKPMLVAVTIIVTVKYGAVTETITTKTGVSGCYTRSNVAKIGKEFAGIYLEQVKADYADRECTFKVRHRTQTIECTQVL